MFDIAIVGFGAVGVSLLANIRNQVRAAALDAPRIVVFAPTDSLARGEAFGGGESLHLVNTSPDMLPLSEAEPQAFTRWLSSLGRAGDRYPPRKLFADFLESEFETIRRGGVVEVTTVPCAVDAISKRQAGVELQTAAGAFRAKRAVLCIGSPRSSNFPEFADDPHFSLAYDRADAASANDRDDSPVLVAGTSLTAVDMFRSLNVGRRREIHLFSRHGLPPTCLTSQVRRLPRHFSFDALSHRAGGRLLLHDFLAALKEDCREIQDGGEHVVGTRLLASEGLAAFFGYLAARADEGDLPYQDLLVSTRPHMHELWRMLSIEDRVVFLLNHGAAWAAWRHPVPRQVVHEMQAAASESRLFIHRAIGRPGKSAAGFEITTSEGRIVRGERLIDATGGASRIDAMDSQLLAQLHQARLVQAHPCGGVDIHPLTFECRVNGVADERLSCLGPLTRGALFSTNAFAFNARCAAHWARMWAVAETRSASAIA